MEALLDKIYEAAVHPDGWPSVLDDIGQVSGSAGAILLTRRSDQWIGWRVSEALETGVEAYLRSDAAARSATSQRLIAFDRAGFIGDDQLFSDEDYRADSYVTGYALPNGLFHGAATAIHVPTGDLLIVQAQRRVGQPPFDTKSLQALDLLRPHLARAGLLAARLRFERLRAVADILERIGVAAAILGFDHKVLVANRLIETLGSGVVWRSADRLTFTDPAAAPQLFGRRGGCGSIRDPRGPFLSHAHG